MRERFQRKLNELRDDILAMGSMVEEELKLALQALETLDTELVHQVFETDKAVNEARFAIENKCFELIVTQQPAAGDLRSIVAVMNMIVDLERMGDKAKSIGKIVPRLVEHPKRAHLPEIRQLGETISLMLKDAMIAYVQKDVELAKEVAARDSEVDALYAQIFTKTMERLAGTKKQAKVEVSYEVLRAARDLERIGDLTTNITERVIYTITGELHEVNIDTDPYKYLGRPAGSETETEPAGT